MRRKRTLYFFLMIVLGLVAGLIYGWIINPIRASNPNIAGLRADYQADYVLMTAEIYHADQNLEQATRRLSSLGKQPAAQTVTQAISTAKGLGYNSADLATLTALSDALQPVQSATATGEKRP